MVMTSTDLSCWQSDFSRWVPNLGASVAQTVRILETFDIQWKFPGYCWSAFPVLNSTWYVLTTSVCWINPGFGVISQSKSPLFNVASALRSSTCQHLNTSPSLQFIPVAAVHMCGSSRGQQCGREIG